VRYVLGVLVEEVDGATSIAEVAGGHEQGAFACVAGRDVELPPPLRQLAYQVADLYRCLEGVAPPAC